MYKPQCDLDPSWEEEDLTKATIRTINLVHAHTAAVKELDTPHRSNHFTAPGFCYVFPLLKQGMRYCRCPSASHQHRDLPVIWPCSPLEFLDLNTIR